MTRLRAVVLLLIAAGTLIVAGAGSAQAHPLGNFSINRFSGIEVMRDTISIHYVVDMAEVPTFQQRDELDADGDGDTSSRELARFADRAARDLAPNLSLRADGSDVGLAVISASAQLGRGQGGLEVLRMEFEFAGPLPASEARVQFRDDNYAGNLGWREVVAYTGGGQGMAASDVPVESVSDELREYPRDLLSSPLDVTQATIDVAPGAAPSDPRPEPSGIFAGPLSSFVGSSFVGSSLVEREPSQAFTGVALLLALLSGALHALGPGHGKTVMAAYLVGTAGRARHAVAVGAAISLMHTASVIGLCLVTLWAQRVFAPEAVYPWLSLMSGVVVLGLGAFLLSSRLRARRAPAHSHGAHAHSHGAHGDHDHSHGGHGAHAELALSHGGRGHSHAPDGAPGSSPLSWRGLGALALSGGLLPSPAALVVLLGAVALGRVAFGLLLVLCFSIGLAGALTLIGILVLRAKEFTARRFGRRSVAALPVLSAATILAMGLFLTTRAAMGF